MSWSVSGVGKPRALAAALATQISNAKCSEPEESIKSKVGEIISAALGAMAEGTAVEVTASGSQSFIDYNNPELGATNSLRIEIRPLWGFCE